MATNHTDLIPAKQLESIQSTQYTANGKTGLIDKFTLTNIKNVNVTVSINIVSQNSTPMDSNLILKEKTIRPGYTDLLPELSGHVITPGSYISTLVSLSEALTVKCSGREIS